MGWGVRIEVTIATGRLVGAKDTRSARAAKGRGVGLEHEASAAVEGRTPVGLMITARIPVGARHTRSAQAAKGSGVGFEPEARPAVAEGRTVGGL